MRVQYQVNWYMEVHVRRSCWQPCMRRGQSHRGFEPRSEDICLSFWLFCLVLLRGRFSVARVRSQVRPYRMCFGQIGTGTGFLRVFRFPLPILIPLTVTHSCNIRGWCNRPNSGRCTKWTQVSPHTHEWKKRHVHVTASHVNSNTVWRVLSSGI
jgi:hypothetical protein